MSGGLVVFVWEKRDTQRKREEEREICIENKIKQKNNI